MLPTPTDYLKKGTNETFEPRFFYRRTKTLLKQNISPAGSIYSHIKRKKGEGELAPLIKFLPIILDTVLSSSGRNGSFSLAAARPCVLKLKY